MDPMSGLWLWGRLASESGQGRLGRAITGRDLGDEDHDRAGVSLGQGDPPVVQGEVVVLGPRPEVPGGGEGVDCGLSVDPPLAGAPGAVEGDDGDDLDDGGAEAVQAPAGGGGGQATLTKCHLKLKESSAVVLYTVDTLM